MKYPETTVECAVELSSSWSRHERLHNGDGMLKNVLIEAEDRMQRLDIFPPDTIGVETVNK